MNEKISEHYICTTPGCLCEGKTNQEIVDEVLNERNITGEQRAWFIRQIAKLIDGVK